MMHSEAFEIMMGADPLLNDDESLVFVKKHGVHFTKSTWRSMRSRQIGPRYIRIAGRPYSKPEWLREFLASRITFHDSKFGRDSRAA